MISMSDKPQGTIGQPDFENLPKEMLSEFLEVQKINAQNAATQLKLKEKELEINGQLAHKSLDYQREHLKSQLPENRKTHRMYALFGLSVLIIIFVFIGYCLYIGKEDIAKTVFIGLAALATHTITYVAGKKTGESKSGSSPKGSTSIDDAEVVEE